MTESSKFSLSDIKLLSRQSKLDNGTKKDTYIIYIYIIFEIWFQFTKDADGRLKLKIAKIHAMVLLVQVTLTHDVRPEDADDAGQCFTVEIGAKCRIAEDVR